MPLFTSTSTSRPVPSVESPGYASAFYISTPTTLPMITSETTTRASAVRNERFDIGR
jgi:hypothetical protein